MLAAAGVVLVGAAGGCSPPPAKNAAPGRPISPAGTASSSASSSSASAPSASASSTASSGSSGPTGAAVIGAAYTKTVAAKTARLFFTEHLTTQGGTGAQQNVTVSGAGVTDFPARAFDLTLNLPAGGSVETRDLHNVLYEHVPAAAAKLPGHKPWLKIDLTKLQQRSGVSAGQMPQGNQADPSQLPGYLQGVSDQVHQAGHATIHGVPTTEYDATVDLTKAATKQTATPGAREAIARAEQQPGTHTLPMKLWVDSTGLVHQLAYHLVVHPKPAAGQTGTTPAAVTLDLSMQLYDFGTPVHVTASPAAQTTDLTNRVPATH